MPLSAVARFLPAVGALLLLACGVGSEPEPRAAELAAEAQPEAVALSVPKPRPERARSAAALEARTLDWDELIPADYRPEELLQELGIDELEDDDPRVDEILDRLRAAWDEAPVVEELDGATVRLPGFVVPLDGDGQKITEFLLVPYYGACIHVPPPPANQTVYVIAEAGVAIRELFDVVWVTGTLTTGRTESELAVTGYTLHATEVVPYE
jgi:uncharacterized protein